MANFNIPSSIPDAAIPKVRAAFGGSTNAETLAAVQAWAGPRVAIMILAEALERNIATRTATAVATERAAQQAVTNAAAQEQAEMQSVWPQ